MRVWTFVVRGGQAIGIQLTGSPPLEHNGGMTLWKMLGTEDQADAIRGVLEAQGCGVERYSEVESPEQQAERLRRLDPGSME